MCHARGPLVACGSLGIMNEQWKYGGGVGPMECGMGIHGTMGAGVEGETKTRGRDTPARVRIRSDVHHAVMHVR
jgi:hypothetical protein